MELAFAVWLLIVGNVPVDLGAEIYRESIAVGVEPAVVGGLLMYEHPGGLDDPDNYLPPYGKGGGTASGILQLQPMWKGWAEEEHGVAYTTEEFEQDPTAGIKLAVLVVAYFDERHENHAGDHRWGAHWTCNNEQRAEWDETGESSECEPGVRRIERQIDRARQWRIFAFLFLWFDVLRHPIMNESDT